jgi:hypothetical protein
MALFKPGKKKGFHTVADGIYIAMGDIFIKRITIRNKAILKELFGKDGISDGLKRYKVELAGDNILKIIDY